MTSEQLNGAEPPDAGIYVPVPTFFHKESGPCPSLDLETQESHALFLLGAGIKGLVVLGSTGEAIAITSSERSELTQRLRLAFDKNGFHERPLIVGTTAQALEEVLAQLRDAHDAGASYGLVLAPGYFASAASQDGIAQWFEAVADRSPLPILVYHYPAVSNNLAIAPGTMERLAAHSRIVGCKLSHGDLAMHARVAAAPSVGRACFATFTGMGQQLLPVLSVGGAGAIDGLAGVFPRTVVALFSEYRAQKPDAKLMRELQREIAGGYEPILRWGIPAIKAAIRRELGYSGSDVARLPLRAMDSEAWATCEPAFAALAGREKSLRAKDDLKSS